MNDQNQSSKIAGIVVALLTLVLGYGFVHENLQSPRPYSLLASFSMPDTEDNHRVESRLWQDPFEPFESPTNQTDEPGQGSPRVLMEDWTNYVRQLLWNDITNRAVNNRIAILGIMLPGGSYPENKEVRLRLRYAAELALLTQDVGPEDSTHIYTNSVWLNLTSTSGETARLSQYAYEWFNTINDPTGPNPNKFETCVLWLNEDDFSDKPAWRLASLLANIPALTNGTNVSFYLVGPHASGTLQALAQTDPTTLSSISNLQLAAKSGHFQILSPGATASVLPDSSGDEDDHGVSDKLTNIFHVNIFHNWIATDERIANLISRELVSRLNSPAANTNNVVVLLSEQDTYYGRKLAKEWACALVSNQVCADTRHVWQFSYLGGLDGSKPQAEAPDQPPPEADTPEATLQTVLQQQQQGERADGDAQLDYIVRLGEFLKEKDGEIKNQSGGRIIAVGFTSSDVYDKLVLLEELHGEFPEAVFFTSDLDASLWTAEEQRYARNLLVGSAYSVNPNIAETKPSRSDQFTSFRDVYQTAVYRACSAIIKYEKNEGADGLNDHDLQGGLYKIGRYGPVPLSIIDGIGISREPDPVLARWLPLLLLLVTLAGMLIYFIAAYSGGIEQHGQTGYGPPSSIKIRNAEDNERLRQISYGKLLAIFICVVSAGLAVLGFHYLAWETAATPGEEPWSFFEGVSIWPSEYIRLLIIFMVIVFFYVAYQRRRRHRKILWKNYFREDGSLSSSEDDENWDKLWKDFYEKCLERWKPDLKAEDRQKILESDAHQIWKKEGEPSGRALDDWIQAEAELERERKISLVFGWTPPFIEVQKPGMSCGACINASALFRCYLHLGLFRERFKRIGRYVFVYMVLSISIFFCLNDIPAFSVVRGPLSQLFDTCMVLLAALGTLVVLFYVFDATILTKRVLDYISRNPTCWPEPSLLRRAVEFGVQPGHLDGLLDVDFAAVQTAEIGPLMFGPIILQLLLVLSRSPCFDTWTFPVSLSLIFVMNFSAAALCWFIVRLAADKVKKDAQYRLEQTKLLVKNYPDDYLFEIPSLKNLEEVSISVNKTDYLNNLEKVDEKINEEQRGAFARWFQDPTYLAVFIPSGATGIISIIASFLLRK